MSKLSALFGGLLLIVPIVAVSADGGDTCDDASRILFNSRVTLQFSTLDKHGVFVGTFLVENLDARRAFELGGVQAKDGVPLRVERPDTSIEYLDLSNQWQRMIEIPGSYYGPKDFSVVTPGKSVKFTAALFSAETASRNAREFRLLIRTHRPSACLTSIPFRAYPPRPAVTRLESVAALARP